MLRVARNDSKQRGNLWRAAGVFLVVASLAFGAFALTNSRATEAAIERASAVHRADLVMAGSDIALKSLGQMVLLAEDRSLGVADAASVEAAITEAEASLDDLRNRHDGYAALSSSAEIGDLVADVLASGGRTVERARNEDAVGASNELLDGFVPSARDLTDAVTAARDGDAAELARSRAATGRTARLAGFLTAFLLPLAAMLAYRYLLRRQLQLAEVQLDARLDAEREVVRAKNEFIANISHELRTPLTSIYGFSMILLEQGLIDPETTEDMVTLINKESAELGRMVEDLLVAAQEAVSSVALVMGEVDVATEVEAVVEPMERLGTTITCDVEAGSVHADKLRVRQILRNLLSNADQHGGPTIRLRSSVEDARHKVLVEDDGDGVPEAMQERLFSHFVHEGDEALTMGSVGLGLAVARALATAMGGSLEYARADGWTSFTLDLPIFAAEVPEPTALETATAAT